MDAFLLPSATYAIHNQCCTTWRGLLAAIRMQQLAFRTVAYILQQIFAFLLHKTGVIYIPKHAVFPFRYADGSNVINGSFITERLRFYSRIEHIRCIKQPGHWLASLSVLTHFRLILRQYLKTRRPVLLYNLSKKLSLVIQISDATLTELLTSSLNKFK